MGSTPSRGLHRTYTQGGTAKGACPQGGGRKKNRNITIFLYSPPMGGYGPKKSNPAPMCKKSFATPIFF